MPSTNPPFAEQLLQWFDQHGRHDLPWQTDRTPYRVWISEIMLQQTQVSTVIPYFERFIDRFATVEELALAETDQVLHLWTGLGYYARARNLHKAAKVIVQTNGGSFPDTVEDLMELDGIGQSTAGAIAAISMGVRAPILDGNVKRVLARYHCIAGWPEQSSVKKQLWEIAESLTPHTRVDDYTQAIMDLGATVCTRSKPSCQVCPFQLDCGGHQQGRATEFPGKKAKKALPVKSVAMFILQNAAGEVLLEKRPATGIWGSLYSLPETAEPSTTPKLMGVSIGNRTDSGSEELEKIRHSFSHYHLDITPVRIRATKLDEIAETDRWLWYPLDHSLEVGLAAPVKKLLSKLAEKP
ncbi:MAG: A/G-specific adenine glycosylase [SAR86 cluster bacterium]|uniref:Adenine DNA glycosylase n=1 Tax=SAR86 cluster bacterium TaxID=2030880 RepID=A0A2A4WZE1_9GAMM|nr:MAG: A/G-specific adenine glycosylase [SAR86 cluster bacterium]